MSKNNPDKNRTFVLKKFFKVTKTRKNNYSRAKQKKKKEKRRKFSTKDEKKNRRKLIAPGKFRCCYRNYTLRMGEVYKLLLYFIFHIFQELLFDYYYIIVWRYQILSL